MFIIHMTEKAKRRVVEEIQAKVSQGTAVSEQYSSSSIRGQKARYDL